MKFFRRKVLVGVSGGPDSMYLLDKLNYSLFLKPIAIHINYHFRNDSDNDENIVKEYCQKHKIVFFSLNVDENVLEGFKNITNQEALAREIRYSFFEKISKELNVNVLYIAHHKNDFLETAIMQQKRSNDYLFYGLKRKSFHHNLIIKRPLLRKTSNQIMKYCKKKYLPFAIDSTNLEQKYERNKIRFNLLSISKKEEDKLFNYFKKLNASKEGQRRKVSKIFKKWKLNNFSLDFFKSQQEKFKINLIYEFLSNSNAQITINTNKILGIIEFLNAKNFFKEFELNDLFSLKVENKSLLIVEK